MLLEGHQEIAVSWMGLEIDVEVILDFDIGYRKMDFTDLVEIGKHQVLRCFINLTYFLFKMLHLETLTPWNCKLEFELEHIEIWMETIIYLEVAHVWN